MNSRDAYGSYDVRAYALGILKEFQRVWIPRGRDPTESVDENVLHKAIIPQS